MSTPLAGAADDGDDDTPSAATASADSSKRADTFI
jgi:hypothetical protein